MFGIILSLCILLIYLHTHTQRRIKRYTLNDCHGDSFWVVELEIFICLLGGRIAYSLSIANITK